MKTKRISLQIKIFVLAMLLGLLLILLLTVSFSYKESKQIEENKGRMALELSKTVSFIPTVITAFQTNDPAKTIQPLAEKIRKETGAEFIVIGNKNGIRYSHPLLSKIGGEMEGGDNDRALQNGEYYISKSIGTLGPSIRGKSPIFNQKGEIIGIVSVGFLLEDIHEQINKNIVKVLYVALFALFISVTGSIILGRNIRKDTMGLEPYEIARLYKEKNAILHAVKEGILAIDQDGYITTMNIPAKKLLNLQGSVRHMKVDGLFPSEYLYEVLRTGAPQIDKEMVWNDKTVIVNCTPLFDGNKNSGVVVSFRDKTEIEQMVNTISEVKSYSEDLRAQTHEFTNKLYVLLGLLQLGEYQQAIEMIQTETQTVQFQNSVVFNQIKDTKIQAILLGKLGKSSEKKIKFEIASDSYLGPLPPHIKLSNLIVILGNIIDNAFEAVYGVESGTVKFFTTDIGSDIIFEIADNGKGISDKEIPLLFQKGYTTKNGTASRGFGLWNAEEATLEMNGMIEVQSAPDSGTVFTVYLPKELKRRGNSE
ncbi:ATP-binding protein [Pseudoneobacillus rhizosphaerae]|uniref:histidine kinase n=1 Tax=Pseudoneobacillus rhizosphaerae TaxID=2880968 RepID=A0A9C7LBX9_9BACI|nr:sensor histidine kinase [Pseudoneobacillus rhizosphaerae]CAG9609030.1 Sensor protein CitS [Pseudoneobacillus rhizosphaerae]